MIIMICLSRFTAVSQSDTFSSEKRDVDLAHIIKYLPQFSKQLESASQYGLDKNDYDFSIIRRIAFNTDSAAMLDSTVVKKRILSAMNRFFDAILNGRVPRLSYNGLPQKMNYEDVSELVNESLRTNNYAGLPKRYEITNPLYQSLRAVASEMNDSLFLKPSLYSRRLRSAQNALHTFRWLNPLLKENENTIVVNIPSATLLLFSYENPVFESKVIVGTKSTRTPRIASVLTDITIYPYWMVPKSIAIKELLPEIKKDLSYLERNNFQVLNKKGKIVSPHSVPWNTLNAETFPYTIRQSTGCDNSLGLIKLNINNPFNVYLHDTPWKSLFESANRFYSHGCVRVEKAKQLSHILLKENSIAVDTLDEKVSLLGREPTVLKLHSTVPVLILYNTAWFDVKGYVRFYPDVYSRRE